MVLWNLAICPSDRTEKLVKIFKTLITRWQVSTYLFKVFGLLHEILGRFRILQNLWRDFETHRRQQFHFADKMNESWVVVDSHQFVAVERDHRRIVGQAVDIFTNESRKLHCLKSIITWESDPEFQPWCSCSTCRRFHWSALWHRSVRPALLWLRLAILPYRSEKFGLLLISSSPVQHPSMNICKWRNIEMCYLSFKLSCCINLL